MIALVIAAEAASAARPPSEARRLAEPARWPVRRPGSIAIFAGHAPLERLAGRCRRAAADGPDPVRSRARACRRRRRGASRAEAGRRRARPEPSTADRSCSGSGMARRRRARGDVRPDPAAELDAGRSALVAGALDQAALRFGLALRLAPALAPAVLEATEGARSAGICDGPWRRLPARRARDVGPPGLRRRCQGRPAASAARERARSRSDAVSRRSRPRSGSTTSRSRLGPGRGRRADARAGSDRDRRSGAAAAATDAAEMPTSPSRPRQPTHRRAMPPTTTASDETADSAEPDGCRRPGPDRTVADPPAAGTARLTRRLHPIQSRASSPTVPR